MRLVSYGMRSNRVILGEYRALEGALWAEIERLQADDRLAAATVVAPSSWLIRHLKLAAAQQFPDGLFGVRFATLFQFALALAGDRGAGFVPYPIFHERLLLQWLESVGASMPVFAGAEVDTYDFAGALAAAVRDLRDAAVSHDPELILECLSVAVHQDGTRLTAMDVEKFAALLHAYHFYTEALSRIGVLDRADIFRAAAANAGQRCGPLLVYGFYDMIQGQADMIAELARHGEMTLFVPYGADADTWAFGRWFRETFVPTVAVDVQHLPSVSPPPPPEIHTAAGERDEVWFCAKEIRDLLDAGCAPEEIAVVARTLDPYLRHVEALFREHAIPYEGPSSLALLGHPLAQVLRLFLRLALEGFPRAAVLDVACHPLFRAPANRRYWGVLAQALRVGRGSDWLRLGQYAEAGYRLRGRQFDHGISVPAEDVRALVSTVKRLMTRSWPDEAGWRDQAEAHRTAIAETFSEADLLPDEALALASVHDVLDSLACLDRLGGSVSRGAFLEAFDRECGRRFLPGATGVGVALMDAMDIRGLGFRHVFLLGANARTFPRFIVEEPFISDPVRREVFRVLGHHLAVRMDGYDEERLLFHLVRSAAKGRFVCVYQRADTKGRLRDPSPFLRPFLPLDRALVNAVPRSDAAKRLGARRSTPKEQILTAGDVAAALTGFGYASKPYIRGRAMLDELDGTVELSEFEGRTGPLAASWRGGMADEVSPTGLEFFAACPFRYFAENVLQLGGMEDPAAEDDMAPRDLGRLMHAILERLYRLHLGPGVTSGLGEMVRQVANDVSAEFESETGIALRGLLAIRREQVMRAVEIFAAWDLGHLGPWRPVWFEETAQAEFAGIRVRARLDRVDRHEETGALRIIEYKRRFGNHWRTALDTQAKRGSKLQGPLYLEVVSDVAARHGHGEACVSEIVFQFVENYTLEDPSVEPIHEQHRERQLSAEKACAVRPHVEKAVKVFGALIRDGWFFIRPDESRGGLCPRCDFAAVCRKAYGVHDKSDPERTPALRSYWDVIRSTG